MTNAETAKRIAEALYENKNEIEYFIEIDNITEKDIYDYIDESYDIFPVGTADAVAPLAFKIYQQLKNEGA